MYKGILFDIDGTLLDTFPMNFYPLIRIIKEELNIDYTYEEVLKYAPLPGMKTMELLGIKDKDTTYARWVRYVNKYGQAQPFEGITELLSHLHDHYKIGIVSAKKRDQYNIDMKDLDQYIDAKVLEEDTSDHKPSPIPLLLCIDKLGLHKEDVLYVGDACIDAKAAKNAGIDFAYASWGSVEDVEGRALRTPEDLLKLLEEEK